MARPEIFEPGGLMPGLEKAFVAYGRNMGLTRKQGREAFALAAAGIDTLVAAGGKPFSPRLDDQLRLMDLAAGRGLISRHEAERLADWARRMDAAKDPAELKTLLFESLPAEADTRLLLDAVDIGQHSHEFWAGHTARPCGEGEMSEEEALAQLAGDPELMRAILKADMYGGLISGAVAGFLMGLAGPLGIGGGIIIGTVSSGGSGVCSMVAAQASPAGGNTVSDGWGVGWHGEGHCQ